MDGLLGEGDFIDQAPTSWDADYRRTWAQLQAAQNNLRIYRRLHSQRQAELAAAKEQGRREALQAVPLGALERAARHCDSMMDYETGGIISDWSESARDAQEGGGG